MDTSLVPAVAELDFVWRVEPYQPWYRLHQPVREWLEAHGGGFEDTIRVRAMAFEWGEEGKARIAQAAREMGAGIAATWPSGHVIELQVTRNQLRRLAAHNDVLWIDLWSPPGMDMDLVREDSGADWIEDPYRYCGQGVRGEVFDSGIESTHIDFDGIMIHGPTPSVNSHGTSVYGIVFGNGFRDDDSDTYTECDGDCNDNDDTVYPGASEICDYKDNNCDGTIDEGYPTPAETTGLLFDPDKQTMNWNVEAQSDRYDVTKGDLAALISSGGDFTSSLTSCLEDDSADTQAFDSEEPTTPGNGFYYLIRAQADCRSGTYNANLPGQVGDRDPEIAASPNNCP